MCSDSVLANTCTAEAANEHSLTHDRIHNFKAQHMS